MNDAPAPAESGPSAAQNRLRRLTAASPLYAALLRQDPEWHAWLEDPANLDTDFRYQALLQEWSRFSSALPTIAATDDAEQLERLRRWRRMISLRVAYRSVNGLCSEKTAVEELSRLAEFCLRHCYEQSSKQWYARYGVPHDEHTGAPARFCVLAMGKLGGQELNFSSDIDLVFVYEGDGPCRLEGKTTRYAAVECFTRIAETLCTQLSAQTPAGFLFRVDARLRPEGGAGPLVRSFSSWESYYALAGQTWERLALLKARAVAGDATLGEELLESLHSFRYPRNPPPSLLQEVAGMKRRTERKVVGAEDDVKAGPGGIRDVEFIVQSFQLLHAGRYPFLQTHSTQNALEQLARYGLLSAGDAVALEKAYWFLRTVENRLQMREEQQTHTLPKQPEIVEAVAHACGFASVDVFLETLHACRTQVRQAYEGVFPAADEQQGAADPWWRFFSTAEVPDVVAAQLQRWFGAEPAVVSDFRQFACGSPNHTVTRDQVMRVQQLASTFDAIMPQLAQPLLTLKRIARFAERYGPRTHFLGSCASNPQFFRVLALLFDRSAYIHERLCAHPEIFEEVLRPEILVQRKDRARLRDELARGPHDAAAFAGWLALYVRAEQVRYAIAELTGFTTLEQVERDLAQLADAVFEHLCDREPELKRALLVALGKHGGEELSFASDLDMVVFATPDDVDHVETALRSALRLLRDPETGHALYSVDVRLRAHGEAGPLVGTLEAFRDYHRTSAQFWERQALTRARVIGGPTALGATWWELHETLLYSRPLSSSDLETAWQMRLRLEREKDQSVPPELAFKTGAGGLLDVEFFAQLQQMLHGPGHPTLRLPSTRSILRELAEISGLVGGDLARLLENYNFVKRLEMLVRRDTGEPRTTLPADCFKVARWMGFPNTEGFMTEHRARLRATRELVLKLLHYNGER